MGVGIAIDVTNEAVILSDCSLGGKCRYCEEDLCVGCSNMPVFIEKGEIVCPLCRINNNVKVPDHARIFTHSDDYFEVYGEGLADDDEEGDGIDPTKPSWGDVRGIFKDDEDE